MRKGQVGSTKQEGSGQRWETGKGGDTEGRVGVGEERDGQVPGGAEPAAGGGDGRLNPTPRLLQGHLLLPLGD